MKQRRILALTALTASLALARWQPAEACTAPLTYVTLAPTQAADGATGVALDAPLVLHASVWPNKYPLENFNQLQKFSVTVKATGATTAVTGVAHLFSGQLSWVPDAPLSPSTTYEVTVHVTNDQAAPGDATGPVDQQFSFTTGTASLPPLAFTSAPSYAFATLDYPLCPPGKEDDCDHCSEPTTTSYPSAVVTLPTVSGGAVSGGYVLSGWVTDSSGAIKGSAWRHVGDTATTVQVPLFPAQPSYEPCLHVSVSDATGKLVSTEMTCFPGVTVTAIPTGSAGSGGAAGAASATPGADDSGCSTSGRSGPGGALLVGLAAAAAWLGRRRVGARALTS